MNDERRITGGAERDQMAASVWKLADEVAYAIRRSDAFHTEKRERLARWAQKRLLDSAAPLSPKCAVPEQAP